MAKAKRKLRIFMGLVDVASYYSGLKIGFDALGIEAVFLSLYPNRFSRAFPENPPFIALDFFKWTFQKSQHNPNSHFYLRLFAFAKFVVFAWAAVRFDVFIFGFATTFYNYRELRILKLLRKKVIYVFHGSDSRPPYMSGAYVRPEYKRTMAECAAAALRMKSNIAIIERYSYACVNHPPQAHFHERQFINHCFVGHPCEFQAPVGVDQKDQPGEIRIVHAPSSPGPKGTHVIRKIVDRLKDEGFPINYIEMIERSNAEVLHELSRCDLVIDELYSDIPLAGLGTEAAFFGKPAVVGGYAQEVLASFSSKSDFPTQLYVRPDEVESVVRSLLVDSSRRKDLGAVAEKFVRANWTPIKVAGRFLQIIEGSAPSEWWYNPAQITYPYGWGISESELKNYLAKFINEFGILKLQLKDKPTLVKRLVEVSECAPESLEHIVATSTNKDEGCAQ